MVEFHESCGKPLWTKRDTRIGENHPSSKLNAEIVRQIREQYKTQKPRKIREWLLEQGIDVTLACVSNVARKNTWRHVI